MVKRKRRKRRGLETRYLGYRFRSRVEARWALFFTELGLDFVYEPQGFQLDSGKYLPDFYLPDVGGGLWVEVKTRGLTPREERLAHELVQHSGLRLLVAQGDPCILELGKGYRVCSPPGDWDMNYLWCSCSLCGRVGLENDGRSGRILCLCPGKLQRDDIKTPDDPRIVTAAAKARSERFGIHN